MSYMYIKNIEAIEEQINKYISIPNQTSTISTPYLKIENHQANFEIEENGNSINAEFEIPVEPDSSNVIDDFFDSIKECSITTESEEYHSDKCLLTNYTFFQVKGRLLIQNLKTSKKEPERMKYIKELLNL